MKSLSFFLAIGTLILLDACKCNEDFDLDRDFLIGFDLFDKNSGENLLEITSKYRRDSVQIYNDSMVLIYPGPVPGDGSVYFHPYKFIDREIELNEDKTVFFYLYLRDQTVDVDTFKLEYYARIGECNEKEFTYLNFYYNEELVYESNNPSFGFDVDIFK